MKSSEQIERIYTQIETNKRNAVQVRDTYQYTAYAEAPEQVLAKMKQVVKFNKDIMYLCRLLRSDFWEILDLTEQEQVAETSEVAFEENGMIENLLLNLRDE